MLFFILKKQRAIAKKAPKRYQNLSEEKKEKTRYCHEQYKNLPED